MLGDELPVSATHFSHARLIINAMPARSYRATIAIEQACSKFAPSEVHDEKHARPLTLRLFHLLFCRRLFRHARTKVILISGLSLCAQCRDRVAIQRSSLAAKSSSHYFERVRAPTPQYYYRRDQPTHDKRYYASCTGGGDYSHILAGFRRQPTKISPGRAILQGAI